MFTVVEQTPSDESYEKLKTLAQRVERSRDVAKSLKLGVAEKEARSNTQWRKLGNPSRSQAPELIGNTKQRAAAPQEIQQDQFPTGKGDIKKRGSLCHNCKKPGHFRRDCRELPKDTGNRQTSTPSTEKVRKTDNTQGNQLRTFTTTLGHWSRSASMKGGDADELSGSQTLETVELLGCRRSALLDTGSQISILPLKLLQMAAKAGFDLDNDVEEIEDVGTTPIYDASGKPMVFKGAVRLTLRVKGSPRMRAAFYVMKGGDGMIVIGTNILHNLGYRLQNTTRSTSPQISVESRSRTWKNVKESESKCTQTFDMGQESNAKVVTRVYIKPGETKLVEVTANTVGTENILWSTDKLIADAIHTTTGATVQIPITNLSPETKVYKMGDVIGEWEKCPITEEGSGRNRVAAGRPVTPVLSLLLWNLQRIAHVGLPGLRCNLARSKKVKNLFELANVASIALEPAWGEHRKEAELMNKKSTHLTVVGLSCAISAHRHFCHDFATAVAEKEGVNLLHPPIFSQHPGYDISAYYAQAMARK
ncbi:unnamed protein product [Heligmosomoides polygyrus]|uniref:CCHC-type domain-containing protein n=1 Tax=Heligmosomoides polygyrus TaxID=6339 RepID=A0A3P8CPP4_HELPZ|nr:unnamed protein product [Heligmosomoides polygyrus]